MSTKVSDALLKRLEEAALAEPQREIPVIVTLTEGTDLAALEAKGLKIQRTFQNMSAVAGTLTVAEANAIEQLDQVRAIEYDEKAWAL
jgi:hypothetical protein